MTGAAPGRVALPALVAAVLVAGVLGGAAPAVAASTDADPSAHAADAALTVDVAAERDAVVVGESVTVTVTVANDGDATSPAPVFALDDLPAGWSVATWSGDATYRSATNEWLWTAVDPGETRTLTITLNATTPATDATVGGTVSDGEGHTADGAASLTVRPPPTTAAPDETTRGSDSSGTASEGAPPDTTDDSAISLGDGAAPGAGPLGAGAAVVAAVALLWRSRGR